MSQNQLNNRAISGDYIDGESNTWSIIRTGPDIYDFHKNGNLQASGVHFAIDNLIDTNTADGELFYYHPFNRFRVESDILKFHSHESTISLEKQNC